MRTCSMIPVSELPRAKTRLSTILSTAERENLLKAMIRDVTSALNNFVDEIVIVSSDENILEFGYEIGVEIFEESEIIELNGALEKAIDEYRDFDKVLIIPADVPLVLKCDIHTLINKGKEYDIVIAPSKGGGTNALLLEPKAIPLRFGELSFFKHIEEAKKRNLSFYVYDSFYLSVDVNTKEDLGEILLHGRGTSTYKYLKKLGFSVKPWHGNIRLKVEREKW